MKAFIVTVIIVAVSSSLNAQPLPQSPWQVGKLYRYEVQSHTLANLPESASTGSTYKTHFVIRAIAPGRLQARIENLQHALVHHYLNESQLPDNLNYQIIANTDKPIEIFVEGGRVISVTFPPGLSLEYENLLKGLIGSLQIDLSTNHTNSNLHYYNDSNDNEIKQGQFKKMETDVTGVCETLYMVSPVASDWRRELPYYANDEDPFEITKSKSYSNCQSTVDCYFGMPETKKWTSCENDDNRENQLIKRSTLSRFLVGKNGPIYKSKTINTINVNLLMYGQSAEVQSEINLNLLEYQDDNQTEWPRAEGGHIVQNILYSLPSKLVTNDDTLFSSYSPEPQLSREKHSSKPRSIMEINKLKNGSDPASTANENEPTYTSFYLSSKLRSVIKTKTIVAQKLLQELAEQLQNPNDMPKGDFLSKFNVLIQILASMNSGELAQISRSIVNTKSRADEVTSNMWMIFRDAVTESGTLPAFKIIRTWIQENKIKEEEAAEIVANLPRTLGNPTKDTLMKLFNLALSPVVKHQSYLNTTALLSATTLIFTHMNGRITDRHDRFVPDEILPRLSEALKQSIEHGDSHKSQVYIKAIGSLGHRNILQVFAPYLEGNIPMSTYLRTQMIISLRLLAVERDRFVREILYSILRNSAEPYEVRVAAVLNIFKSQPTDAMMQAMAGMTKTDPCGEVRAAIKSAILNAAELKERRFFKLAQSAQAVKKMLTNEQFGQQYSKITSLSQNDNNDVLHSSGWTIIGGEGSLYPKYLRFGWESHDEDWIRESSISAAVSSWETVSQLVKEFLKKDKNQSNTGPEHKYSADKIIDMFNIRYKKERAEASFYFDFMNQRRLFAFGEEDLKQLPDQFANILMDLNNSMKKHYTKVINKKQTSIMFPLASGMPFVYKYKEPAIIQLLSKTRSQNDTSNDSFYVTVNKEISFVYAENHDGSVGFLDTIVDQYASVGLVGEYQFYAPVSVNVEIKTGQVKLQLSPNNLKHDTNILHYRIWPYSANQKTHTLTTISQDPNTKLVIRDNKSIDLNYQFGQEMGSQFEVNGFSYSNDFKNLIIMIRSRDLVSHVLSPFQLRDPSQTYFCLRYLGKQSKSKSVTITAVYDSLYNQKLEGEMSVTASDIADVSPNSPVRRKELINRVVSGIKAARVNVLDISAKFAMADKLEYVFTSAIGHSSVDPKIQYAVFVGRNSDNHETQINAVGKLVRPTSSNLDYVQTLKKCVDSSLEMHIQSDKKEIIHIVGIVERSSQYIEDLQKTQSSQKCLEENSQNNYYQSTCQSVIIAAQAPDSFKLNVSYNLSPSVKDTAYQVYKMLNVLSLMEIEEKQQMGLVDGKLQMNVDWSYPNRSLTVGFSYRTGGFNIRNIKIPSASSHLMSAYQPIELMERLRNYYTRNQYRPYCTVDGSRIRTFSGREYTYSLGRNWHLLMLNQAGLSGDLVVLARRPSEKSQEVYISYRSRNGQNLEIEIAPGPQPMNHNVKIHTNSKKVSEGELTTYWDENSDSPILEYNTAQDGVLLLRIRENYLKVMYDGERVVVIANEGRNYNRGICGIMTGEPRNDYLTPYGIVDEPEQYAASYALPDSNGDPKIQQLQSQAKQMAYQPKNKYTAILQSSEYWKNIMESQPSGKDDWRL